MSKKIDVHIHIGEDLYRRYTPQMALERMDRNGIEYAVISPIPVYPTSEGIHSSENKTIILPMPFKSTPIDLFAWAGGGEPTPWQGRRTGGRPHLQGPGVERAVVFQ